jgi:acyl carrier protein
MGDAIVERLRGMIANELDVHLDLDGIDAAAPLFEGGLELDSFAIVELISLVESRFGFEFSPDDLGPRHFESLNALARLVASKSDRKLD